MVEENRIKEERQKRKLAIQDNWLKKLKENKDKKEMKKETPQSLKRIRKIRKKEPGKGEQKIDKFLMKSSKRKNIEYLGETDLDETPSKKKRYTVKENYDEKKDDYDEKKEKEKEDQVELDDKIEKERKVMNIVRHFELKELGTSELDTRKKIDFDSLVLEDDVNTANASRSSKLEDISTLGRDRKSEKAVKKFQPIGRQEKSGKSGAGSIAHGSVGQ